MVQAEAQAEVQAQVQVWVWVQAPNYAQVMVEEQALYNIYSSKAYSEHSRSSILFPVPK